VISHNESSNGFETATIYMQVNIDADLDKGVDSHDGHVRLTLSVVHKIEVD